MERIHLIGPHDLERLNVSHVHMALPEFMGERDYRTFFREIGKRETVMMLTSIYKAENIQRIAHMLEATHIWLDLGMRVTPLAERLLQNFEVTVILRCKKLERMLADYQFLLEIPQISIAIPCISSETGNGWGRFKFIFDIIQKKIWNQRRRHYLFELENPAELAAYANIFTAAIGNSIEGFVSRRCYIDSRYGIQYSGSWGLLCKPVPDWDLKERYTNSQQESIFVMNDEMIQSFGHGAMGDGLSKGFERMVEV